MDTQSDQQQQATDEATLAAAAKNEGKLDLLLHLERFSNIDIFRRGYYQVSVELTHKNSDGTAVHYATCIPYRPQPPQEQCGSQQQCRCSANVIEGYQLQRQHQQTQFHSKSFNIKYELETADLADFVIFTIDLPAIHDYENMELCLNTNLHFSPTDPATMRLVQSDSQKLATIQSLIDSPPGTHRYVVGNFGSNFHSTIGIAYSCTIRWNVTAGHKMSSIFNSNELSPVNSPSAYGAGGSASFSRRLSTLFAIAKTANIATSEPQSIQSPLTLGHASTASQSQLKQLRYTAAWSKYRDWVYNKHIMFVPQRINLTSTDLPALFDSLMDNRTASDVPILLVHRNYQRATSTARLVDPVDINVSISDIRDRYPLAEALEFLADSDPDMELHEIISAQVVRSAADTHLLVFVHGLAGSPQDFRRYRNFLSHNAPTNAHQLHLLSAANEQDTYVDISVMAKNLAREVQQYLRQRSENIDRISFICHSLGGLIARRAVMEFDKDMRGKLHAYISLATPHLGLRYNRNTILRPLLWLAGTWTKSRSLSQLKMEDHRDPRQSFLYEMSKSPALGWFRHVRFVASPQDAYVPIYSAMAEADPIAISDSKLDGQIYMEMWNNLFQTIHTNPECRFERVYVNFPPPRSHSINEIIGRAAHVALLQDPHFIQLFQLANAWHA